MNRRTFLCGFGAAAGMIYWPTLSASIAVTPSEMAGPFYPVVYPKDRDFDLTQVGAGKGRALGEVITLQGVVNDTKGVTIEDAMVELWQANAAGRYRHPSDKSSAPLDANFQGWAVVQSGAEGGFKFKTVMPGSYQANPLWTRPPHIHFKISKPGYQELVSQMYFPDHPLNSSDLLLARHSAEDQQRMIAKRQNEGAFYHTLVLAKVGP